MTRDRQRSASELSSTVARAARGDHDAVKGLSVHAYPFVNSEAVQKWTRILIANVPPNETLLESFCNSIVGKEGNLASTEWPLLTSTGIWDAREKQLRLSGLSPNEDTTIEETAFCLSCDGAHYWTADKTKSGESVGRLRVLRVTDGDVLLEWENLESERRLRLSRIEHIVCGKRFTLTVSVDRHLRVYDSINLQMLKDIDLGIGNTLKRVVLDAHESKAYVGTQEGKVYVVDLVTGDFKLLLTHSAEITALATSAEGILAFGDPDGSIKLWNIAAFKPEYLCSLVTQPNSILALEFSADRKKLAVQVDGELAVRVLDWPAFKSRLKEFDLLWSQ